MAGSFVRAAADGGKHAAEAGGGAVVIQVSIARGRGGKERRQDGAHAEGSAIAAGGDDGRADQRIGGWRPERRGQIRAAVSGARSGDLRIAVRLRAADQRTGG